MRRVEVCNHETCNGLKVLMWALVGFGTVALYFLNIGVTEIRGLNQSVAELTSTVIKSDADADAEDRILMNLIRTVDKNVVKHINNKEVHNGKIF